MTARNEAERLAIAWIQGWIDGKPDDIPLADGFKHTSPFGMVEGRQKYLDWVKPMAQQSVVRLEIVRTVGVDGEAAIWYEMQSGSVTTQCCDWVSSEDGQILAVTAFYDATKLR